MIRRCVIPVILLSLLAQGCRKQVAVRSPASGNRHAAKAKKKASPPPQRGGETAAIHREVAPPPPSPPPPPPQVRPSIRPPDPSGGEPPTPPTTIASVEPVPRRAKKTPAKKASRPTQTAAEPPPPQGDTDRPRKLLLRGVTGLPAGMGAFKFDTPALRQGDTSRYRLLVDPKPIIAGPNDKAVLGATDGTVTQVSPTMEAQLTGTGLSVTAEDQARREIDPNRSTEWFWNITPTGASKASVRLDLSSIVNGEKKQVDPFPLHIDQPVTPATPATATPRAPSQPNNLVWILLVAPLLLLAAWLGLRRRKATPVASFMADPGAAAPRTVLRSDEGFVFVMDVLVIGNTAEQSRVEAFCQQLADPRYKFHFGTPGFPVSSVRWQSDFAKALESCDAILIVLTTASLGDKWVNWQLEKATGAQKERDIPMYVGALDEQVLKVSRTVGFLDGLKYYPPTPEGQSELKALLMDSEPVSTRNIRCFISYSHQHREFANKLCSDLNHAGIRTWMDVDGIPGGSTWKRKIAEAIESSTHVLFILTAESVKSDQVSAEIDWAQRKKKTIVPVMELEVDLPFGLLGTQFVSFTQGYEAGFTRLLKDLSVSTVSKKAAGQ